MQSSWHTVYIQEVTARMIQLYLALVWGLMWQVQAKSLWASVENCLTPPPLLSTQRQQRAGAEEQKAPRHCQPSAEVRCVRHRASGLSHQLEGVGVQGLHVGSGGEGGRVDPCSAPPVCLVCPCVLSRRNTSSVFHFYELPWKSFIKDLELASCHFSEAAGAPQADGSD